MILDFNSVSNQLLYNTLTNNDPIADYSPLLNPHEPERAKPNYLPYILGFIALFFIIKLK